MGSLVLRGRKNSLIVVAVLAAAAVGFFVWSREGHSPKITTAPDTEVSSQAKRASRFQPTPAQWASLGMEPVKTMTFRSEHVTEGKISINEDRATPILAFAAINSCSDCRTSGRRSSRADGSPAGTVGG